MDHRQLERYSRHLLLPEIDVAGQDRLLGAAVWIVGAGGLGSPAAMYLASSGVGRIVISDDDVVDLGNLQRQILHDTAGVGLPKVESARRRLRALNPDVEVRALAGRLDARALERDLDGVDVVLDCSDNFATRFDLNAACVRRRRPLVWGAAIRFQGQVTVFDAGRAASPCLACLYPARADAEDGGGCASMGVLAPLTGIIGCVMAAETLKILLGFGDTLCGRLLTLDAARMEWREAQLPRDPACGVCGPGTAGLRASAGA
jgi:molybdopterin/thiamine biosynthesis adenylyltransferase